MNKILIQNGIGLALITEELERNFLKNYFYVIKKKEKNLKRIYGVYKKLLLYKV